MKKVSLLFVCFALACAGADAQSLLERLGQRAKNAAEQNIGNKVEKGVNDILNGNVGKGKNQKKQRSNTEMAGQAGHDNAGAVSPGGDPSVLPGGDPSVLPGGDRASQWTCPGCGSVNTGSFCTECGTRKPAGETAAQNTQQKKTVQTAYAKSDFVPGDEVIYDDPMDDEQLGESPSRLELLAGESEVLGINGKKCFALSHHGDRVSPLMKNPRNFLGDVFTVEFDAFQTGEEEGRLVWEFFPADMDKDPVFQLEIPVSDWKFPLFVGCYLR